VERQKTEIELPPLEQEVLRLCLFEEAFEQIAEECQETNTNVVADAIKNLLHHKLLVATNRQNSLNWMYDGDKMRESTFKATAVGITWMEKNMT
jgi:hypothetical protein